MQSSSAQAARARANLGLPLDRRTRFRFVKRVVYRVSWLFLNHQVAFNHHVLDAIDEALAEITERQEALSELLTSRLEFGLNQSHRQIGDHVARTESELTHLRLQIAQLTARLVAPPEGTHTGTMDESVHIQQQGT